MSRPRLRDITNHLERADARAARFDKIQSIEKYNEDRARRLKVAVAIFALICAAYAITSSTGY